MDAIQAMQGSEKLQSLAAPAGGLTVRIFSFSFHREVPADESGNGGGFVFDARSLPNPGREEHSASSPEKIRRSSTICRSGNVHQFLARVIRWWRPAWQLSAARLHESDGFVGCTGGQHRSVYLAEQLAKHLRGTEGVEVVVRHIELEKMGR